MVSACAAGAADRAGRVLAAAHRVWRYLAALRQPDSGRFAPDAASADIPPGAWLAGLESGVAGLGIGVPRGWPATPAELTEIERIATILREAGARVKDVVLPDNALFGAAGRVILHAEAFAQHARDLRRRPRDYGRAAFRQLVLGATLSAADLLQAQRVRRQLADAMATALARHDALVLPTGVRPGALPHGVQLAGRLFDDATLLRIGRTVEKLSGREQCPRPPFHVD